MDPILIGAVGWDWLLTLASGSLITIGVIEVILGRPLVTFRRVTFSRSESTLLGLTLVVQGLNLGFYGLVGSLLTSRLMPTPGVGHPWVAFASAPFAAVFIAVLGVQALITARSQSRAREGSR